MGEFRKGECAAGEGGMTVPELGHVHFRTCISPFRTSPHSRMST